MDLSAKCFSDFCRVIKLGITTLHFGQRNVDNRRYSDPSTVYQRKFPVRLKYFVSLFEELKFV